MLRITLASLRLKPVRFVATLLAIVVGTGFLAGTLVLEDSLGPALKSNAITALSGVDAAVQPKLTDETARRRRGGLASEGLPAALLDQVRGTNGVKAAAGNLSGPLNVVEGDAAVLKKANGSLYVPVPALDPYHVVKGAAPGRAGQVAIDQHTASRKHWGPGTRLQLATASGLHDVVVVGLTRYGDQEASSPNGDIIVSQADGFSFLTVGAPSYDSIYIQGDAGLSQATLAERVRQSVGDQYQVRTGDELRNEAAGDAQSIADVLGTVLQAFAWVALFVAIFIIYNTFSIVVAQRVREFALLRAIGARGAQIGRAVVLEALIVGVVASAIGMLAGIGLFLLLGAAVPVVRNLTGSGGIPLHVTPFAVVEVVVAGTIVTLVSAVFPAWRAGRTKPMVAMRTARVDRSGTNKIRAVIGLVMIALGAALLLGGMAAKFGLAVGAGPVFLFLGTLIGGPALAKGFAMFVGVGLRRLGPSSRLAVDNAERNPARTATTANALVIGVFLVVFVTAAGGALRDWSVREVSQFSSADLTVVSTSGGIPANLEHQITTTKGVSGSVRLYQRIGEVTAQNGPESQFGRQVAAADFVDVARVLSLDSHEGNLATLGDGEVAVPRPPGRRANQQPEMGDKVTITFDNGVRKQFTIGAVFDFNLDIASYIVSSSAALASDPQLVPNEIALTTSPGQLDAVKDRLDDVTADYSTIDVRPGNIIAQLLKSFFNFIISSVNALLAFAVAIAVFGIVNTLVLSVSERTPEIGLLRAVGMSRRQLRRSVRSESVIVAADGTVVGMVFGLFVAWAVTQPLFTGNESFSWPWREMGLIALIGVVIGIAAALVPAWRASHLDVLDAIAAE